MSSSIGAPRLFGGLLVFIAFFTLTLSAVARDRRLSHRSDSVPVNKIDDSWWWPSSHDEAPVIEIHLLKDHRKTGNENRSFTMEYKYSNTNRLNRLDTSDDKTSGNKLEVKPKDNAKNNETVKESDQDTKRQTDIVDSELGFRTIIDPPNFECPQGQRRDPAGTCRVIIEI
ncbi:uncharacterized protein LOC143145876 [Ptiloglossa arizonensis]|uniref:uncharacterized protein LOC143145876 n=1 Tax=Ptiloglossa arizonensis TaxID=3350558 RepID=UPI003FA0B886